MIHRQAADDVARHVEHHGRAVGRYRVIETRALDEVVGLLDVGEQQRAHGRTWHVDTVEIGVLVTHVGAHAQRVTLVGGDDAHFELFEETADLVVDYPQ